MRRLGVAVRWVLLVLFVAAPVLARAPGDDLRQFAREIGLRDIDNFVATVTALRQDGRLPDRYVTKDMAARAGWTPGDDLCRTSPGKAMGGDRFGNRERRLPASNGRQWYEADLDTSCGKRGAKRLLWSSDGLYYVTVDHYQTFRRVPK